MDGVFVRFPFAAALAKHEAECAADCVPLDTRICPTCIDGEVQRCQWREDCDGTCCRDTCSLCDGSGEIEVEPVDEDDIAEIPAND